MSFSELCSLFKLWVLVSVLHIFLQTALYFQILLSITLINTNFFPANSFKKYIIKANLKMCIFLMYFKIQSGQPIITKSYLKSQIFDLFTKSSLWHKCPFRLWWWFSNKLKIYAKLDHLILTYLVLIKVACKFS